MFSGLIGRRSNTKCKSLIGTAKTRLATLKKKKYAVVRYLKNDIADLLKNNLDRNAYGRTEGLLAEMNVAWCYDMIEQFCDRLSKKIAEMYKQSECPEECREAVSSLMFAAARFADLPELRDLRNMFVTKYGNSLDSYANQEFMARLKQKYPTNEMQIQLLTDIAEEFSIQLDSNAFEQKLCLSSSNFDEVDDCRSKGFYERRNLHLPETEVDTGEEVEGRARKKKDHWRTSSDPVVAPVDRNDNVDTPRGHSRAISLQSDLLNPGSHVHPKLPDYDDLTARLAALRGS